MRTPARLVEMLLVTLVAQLLVEVGLDNAPIAKDPVAMDFRSRPAKTVPRATQLRTEVSWQLGGSLHAWNVTEP